MKRQPRPESYSIPSPLVVSPYQSGSCSQFVESVSDKTTKSIMTMELLLHQGRFSEAADAVHNVGMPSNILEAACIDLYRILLCMRDGNHSLATAIQQNFVQNVPDARVAKLVRTSIEACADPQTEGPRFIAHVKECHRYLAHLSGILVGEPGCEKRAAQPSETGDTAMGSLMACIDAYRATQAGDYAYACGICDAIRSLTAHQHPLLNAYALIIQSASLMHCGRETDAQRLYLQAFEILDADKLYLPLGIAYAFSCGLPEACLRKPYRREYKAMSAIYKSFVAGYAKAHAKLPFAPLLTTDQLALLSPLEASVACLAATNRSNAGIAQFLGCTSHTVKYHLANIYSKLGISRRTELRPHPFGTHFDGA